MTIALDQNWRFKQADNPGWLPAEVPGSVHTDLLKNGVIEDPFYRLNEHDVQWIDKKDWEYQTTFQVDNNLLDKDCVEIVFGSLDTHADVFLNEQFILSANNMFRQWRKEVKNLLKIGRNELRVYFHSPVKIGLQKYDGLDYKIPVSRNDLSEIGGVGKKRVSVHLRKAGYHFGWDWGPRLTTSGIWKAVYLKSWDRAIIRDTHIRQKTLQQDAAQLEATVDTESVIGGRASLSVAVDDEEVIEKAIDLKEGVNNYTIPFTIAQPVRWNPNGLGGQKRYAIKVRLKTSAETLSASSARIGLRTVEVIRDPDASGKSFYVKVNGRPLFMKGANYIPQDVFLNRISPESYCRIIESAAKANMNMLRVWGGGVYETDFFYDLCDEYGILVWQDFMFACAMYPGDEAFLENVRLEAEDNIKRLRNHPCIALWCGNNECLSAWHIWDWKNSIPAKQSRAAANKIWKSYENIFHKILPECVKNFDPDRFYWASSPQSEEGEPENYHSGDAHYWGVWWNKEPFENYLTNIPRFMSEYGFQSFPALKTVKRFAKEEDWDIYSEVMQSHQRSTIGNGTIETYMLRHFKKPKSFPMFLYVGQTLQAEGVKIAIEAHRRNMPYCMGSLFWQLDDCWPVASWSAIDYYGEWKASQYFAKKAFANILVSPYRKGDSIFLFVVSDLAAVVPARLEINLVDFNGAWLWNHAEPIEIQGNTSKPCFTADKKALPIKNPANVVLYVQLLNEDGRLLSDNTLYFSEPKELELPPPDIKTEVAPTPEGYLLKLRSEKLAKNVYLSIPDTDGFFSDNYFDLLPGRSAEILFTPRDDKDTLAENPEIISLRDSYS